MVLSVNTNAGAALGVRTLNKTTRSLNVTQNNISTGKDVNSAKDNAAVYGIAQKLLANIGGLNASKGSIDRAISTVDVGIAAGEAVSGLLVQLKEKAVAASDPGLDQASRDALNNEFVAIRDSINGIVSNASFNGTNAVGGDSVSAVADADASQSLNIATSDFSTGGATVTVSGANDLSSAANAAAAVTAVEQSLTNVGQALTVLGSGASSLESLSNFTTLRNDVVQEGIGNLVDADLAKESASLQALQVKQQLGVKSLAIANQAPAAILSLFNS